MSLEQRIAELERKIRIIEENQEAFEGAVRAFITVFAIRRLPEDPGGVDESEHQ